jgi:coenzyme F420-0:L-glutamate ligase / coenzyme F420-1:gamma-L-glutamate ligase
VNFEDAVTARRSVRAFTDDPVPDDVVERAVRLAVTAPAPHHSQPWRFVLLEDESRKRRFAEAMGRAWADDLRGDGLEETRIEAITARSLSLLTTTPLLVVCCADNSRSHHYPDERRRLAEWSLFAHSIGAALQVFMTSLATDGFASCWISAPVFCRDTVRAELGLPEALEPHALTLVGRSSPAYRPRPRPPQDPKTFIIRA